MLEEVSCAGVLPGDDLIQAGLGGSAFQYGGAQEAVLLQVANNHAGHVHSQQGGADCIKCPLE